jgi:hypothetical protein
MNPWWVTGFIDGDGSFSASIKYKNIEKTRIAFQPSLSISQHSNNILLLAFGINLKNFLIVVMFTIKNLLMVNIIIFNIK